MTQKLGAILVEQGVVTEVQVDLAVHEQSRLGGKLGRRLCELGFTTEREIARAIARQAGVEDVDLDDVTIDLEAVELVPEEVARKHLLIPLQVKGPNLTVAMLNPTNVVAIDELQRLTDLFVTVYAAPESQLERAQNRVYRSRGEIVGQQPRAGETIDDVIQRAMRAVTGDGAREEGVIELVGCLIDMAVRHEATDLHLEPDENALRVRFRVDGELTRGPTLPHEITQHVAARIKIMADLNIAESRIPQDGKIRVSSGSSQVDLRVSTFPSVHGESVVVRVLDLGRAALTITDIGFDQRQTEVVSSAAERPNGLILMTGPTGSGKTTSLYAILRSIDASTRKTITLEDPVEYRLPMMIQCQVNEKAGLTFATGLRAILRHDPDVILVGEMRDRETAAIAMRAALTGHLVLSTLHTNDAIHTLARLRDLEVEAYLISSCLTLVAAQRLARRLCKQCREEYVPDPGETRALGVEEGGTWYRSHGCSDCNERGVRGRRAVLELLEITPEIKSLLLSNAGEDAVLESARSGGFVSLREAAIELARTGEISLQEIARVTAES